MFYVLPAINTVDTAFDVLATIRAEVGKQVAKHINRDTITAAVFTAAVVAKKTANALYCVAVFTAFFCYYLGAQAGKSHYKVRTAAAQIAAEDLALPDPVLDATIAEFKCPELTLLDCGASDADLATLSAHQLRPICAQHGIKWRNAHGKGKHLSKGEMLDALS